MHCGIWNVLSQLIIVPLSRILAWPLILSATMIQSIQYMYIYIYIHICMYSSVQCIVYMYSICTV